VTNQRFFGFVSGAVNLAANLMAHGAEVFDPDRALGGGFNEKDRIICSACVALCLKLGRREGFTEDEATKVILDAANLWKGDGGVYQEFSEIVKLWKKEKK
jgi:hypothetical protein